jgi:hypothetical protein
MASFETAEYNAPVAKEKSRLLSLPYELRLLIWEYAVSAQYMSAKWTFKPHALLQTCRQTLIEVAPCIQGVLTERLNECEMRVARAAEKMTEDNDGSIVGRRRRSSRMAILAFRRKRIQQLRYRLNKVEALIKLGK